MSADDYHFISTVVAQGPYRFRAVRVTDDEPMRYEWTDRRCAGGRWVAWPMQMLPPEIRRVAARWQAEYEVALAHRESEVAWARDWFRGEARCPHCGATDAMQTLERQCDGTGAVESWACDCGGRWFVELREVAVRVVRPETESQSPDTWIEIDRQLPRGVRFWLRPAADLPDEVPDEVSVRASSTG